MMQARLRFTDLKLILSGGSWQKNFYFVFREMQSMPRHCEVIHFKTNLSEGIEKEGEDMLSQ